MELYTKREFDSDLVDIAVCGEHIKDLAYHVGIYWKSEGQKKVIHFINGHNIPIEDYESNFENYFFNPLNEFPKWKLTSFIAFAELASQNKLNCFAFDREIGCYNGGGFDFSTGDYTEKRAVDRFINCGVFVLAFLKTFEFELLKYQSWPNLDDYDLLKNWLKSRGIPRSEWLDFIKQSKEIRGRHILVAPSANPIPANFTEINRLCDIMLPN